MNGAQLVIDYDVTDTTIPVLRNDPIATFGSLVLIDGSNTAVTQPAAGAVPAGTTNGYIPNVVWEEFKELIGSGDETSLRFNSVNNLSGTIGKVEITPKKGIHGIVSQVNHTNKDSQYFSLQLPQAYRDYFAANTAHKFFVSVWRQSTRLAASGVDFTNMAIYFQSTAKYLILEKPTTTTPTGNGTGAAGTYRAANVTSLAAQIKNAYFPGGTVGTVDTPATATANTGNSLMAVGGGMNTFGSATVVNKCPSYITYRVYIEDLTVSGRTYAQVDAIDFQMYQEAFAAGGRFAGDTFTDPATLP